MSDDGKSDGATLPLDELHARVEHLFEALDALSDGEDPLELDEVTRKLQERVEQWFGAVAAEVEARLGKDPGLVDGVKGDHDGVREIFGEMRTLVEDARDDRPVDREHLLASIQAVRMALQEQMQRERGKVWPRLQPGGK